MSLQKLHHSALSANGNDIPITSTLLTIIVMNGQSNPNNFFFFQQPAVYSGGGQVYSNSIYQRALPPTGSGSQITFMVNLQYYAGVQERDTAIPPVGGSSGFESASQPIALTALNNTPANPNSTLMSYQNQALGLSPPVNNASAQTGSFRITTPSYPPTSFFNVGSSVMVRNQIVLSNFVSAQPQYNFDCQPILKFYVQTGQYVAGSVMNFSESSTNAALCDFTGGYTQALVNYTPTGDWEVTMS